MNETRKKGGGSDRRSLSTSNTNIHNGVVSGNSNGSSINGTVEENKAVEQKQNSSKGIHKTVSHDRVRRIVQEEGRTARNLIAWSVPIEDGDKQQHSGASSKASSVSRSPNKKASTRAGSAGREGSPSVVRRGQPDDASRSSGSRASSAAGGKKADLRARYWAFLFDNLKRAVDEIYRTCESDESVDECKEVMLMLEQCTKDFKSLISQWSVIKAYECAEESGQRPTSLAWDLRKTSPGKPHLLDRSTNSPAVSAVLQASLSPTLTDSRSHGGSWADRVQGKQDMQGGGMCGPHGPTDSPRPPTCQPPCDTVKPSPIKLQREDVEGWETVRRSKSKISPCSSVGSLSGGKFRKPCTQPVGNQASDVATATEESAALSPHVQLSIECTPTTGAAASQKDMAAAASRRSTPASLKTASRQATEKLSNGVNTQAQRKPSSRQRGHPRGGASSGHAQRNQQSTTSSSSRAALQLEFSTPSALSGAAARSAPSVISLLTPSQSARSSRKKVRPQPLVCVPLPTSQQLGGGGDVEAGASLLKNVALAVPPVTSSPPNSYRDAALGRRPNSARPSSGRDPEQTVAASGTLPAPTNSTDTGVFLTSDAVQLQHGVPAAANTIHARTKELHTKSMPAASLPEELKAKLVQIAQCDTGEVLDDDEEVMLVEVEIDEETEEGDDEEDDKTIKKKAIATSLELYNDGDEEENVEESDNEEEVLAHELEKAFESALNEQDLLEEELTKEQDQAIETAIMEEESYLKEIEKAELDELTIDLDAEADMELANTASSTGADSLGASLPDTQPLDWDSLLASYEAENEKKKILGLNWGDMVEEAESGSRTPGRGAHLHEKLSSPSRKRSITESKRRYEERQEKARELREKFHSEKTERLKELFKKVEEVRAWKEELLQQKRLSMERKLQCAEEKRSRQLRLKVKKAHEEDNKAHEIAFINTLEAQNKRHEILARHQGIETRLHDRQEERQKKIDEKAAKEQAAEDRRRALDAERSARLLEMQERRRQREEKIGQQLQEREKERLEAAKVREREHRDRLAALEMQQQAHIKELQKKIRHKQEESARRHDENLQHIREKAFVMSIMKHSTEDHNEAPELVPYDTKKLCIVCSVLIPSEVHLLSHLRGKKHIKMLKDHSCGRDMTKNDIESFNLEHIQDAPGDCPDPRAESDKERHKAQRKRCKKLRQRMSARGNEYEAALAQKQETVDSAYKAKISKVVKDVGKYVQTEDRGPWPQSRVSALERSLGELARVIDNKSAQEQTALRVAGGLSVLTRLLQLVVDGDAMAPLIPLKCATNACNIIRLGCKGFYDNCHHMLYSNRLATLVDLLMMRLVVMLPDVMKEGVAVSLCGCTCAGDDQALSSSPVCASVSTTTVVRVELDIVASTAAQALSALLGCLATQSPMARTSDRAAATTSRSGGNEAFVSRVNDAISYMVSVGVVDKLHRAFSSVRGPLDADPALAHFLQHCLNLLTAATRLISRNRNASIFERKTTVGTTAAVAACDDTTGLTQAFAATELVGILSLLYGALLGGGGGAIRSSLAPEQPPSELPPHTIGVVATGLRLVNHIAGTHLNMLQSVLGEEGVSLQFRHIASHLIWYCSHHANEEVLHETVLCVGYFTVLSADNQALMQTGQPPTVLQQLCLLPFQYFSDPRLVAVLYPTLIACCYDSADNRKVIEQELSSVLLANYIEEQLLESQREKLSQSAASSFSVTRRTATPSGGGSAKEKSGDADVRMVFAQRFPVHMWKAALDYFASSRE